MAVCGDVSFAVAKPDGCPSDVLQDTPLRLVCSMLKPYMHAYTRDKDGKKKKKDGDEEGSNEGSADADDDEDDEGEVVWMTDTSEEAAKARAQEQLTAAMASIVTQVCGI